MLHTSKCRALATTTAVSSSNGTKSQIFNDNDNAVTFRTIDGSLMVNATQMAKPFGKVVYDWVRLSSTRAFVSALVENRAVSFARKSRKHKTNTYNLLQDSGLSIAKRGGLGVGGGTYFHEDIAIEFARWLSPAFAVWCNDRIKELFRQGITQPYPQEQPQPTTQQTLTLDDVLSRLREATDLVTALKEERAERERLEAILSGIKSQIDTVPSKSERLPILLPELF